MYGKVANPLTTDQAATRGIEFLNELLALKTREDGVQRSAIGVIGPKDGHDQFAKDVQEVAMLLFAAQQAVPLMLRLADYGRALEAQGTLAVDHGDSYAVKALDHMLLRPDIEEGNAMQWQSIDSAPTDGTVILVEDTNESTAPWAAAKWLSGNEWSGWVYDDEILLDGFPLGPCPTLWLDVPRIPK